MKITVNSYKQSIEVAQTVRTGFSAEGFSATIEISALADFGYNGQPTRETTSHTFDVAIWKKTAKGEVLYEGHGSIRAGEAVPASWYFHKKMSGREYSASNADLPIDEINAFIRTLDIPALLAEETAKGVQAEIEKLESQLAILNSLKAGLTK